MEMTKKIYLETLKSVLGRSILHYCLQMFRLSIEIPQIFQNFNFLPKKVDQLEEVVFKYLDIVVITETKLNDTCPTSQFLVNGFSLPQRKDENKNLGGIVIYIRDYIPNRLLAKYVLPSDFDRLFIELTFTKVNWLLFGTYHSPSQSESYHFNNFDEAFDNDSNYKRVLSVRIQTQKYQIILWMF